MLEVKDLTREELKTLHDRANEFRGKHKIHVDELIRSTKHLYPPSGSDMLHPELWKPAHWAWFLGL